MINKVVLMGRLTANPELRQTKSGKSVCAFTVAVDRRFSKEHEADFISVIAWEKTAEFVSRYFLKGQMIALSGSIQTRKYEDKEGNKRTAFEVVADEVSFCGKNPGEGNQAAETSVDDDSIDGDELPF